MQEKPLQPTKRRRPIFVAVFVVLVVVLIAVFLGPCDPPSKPVPAATADTTSTTGSVIPDDRDTSTVTTSGPVAETTG